MKCSLTEKLINPVATLVRLGVFPRWYGSNSDLSDLVGTIAYRFELTIAEISSKFMEGSCVCVDSQTDLKLNLEGVYLHPFQDEKDEFVLQGFVTDAVLDPADDCVLAHPALALLHKTQTGFVLDFFDGRKKIQAIHQFVTNQAPINFEGMLVYFKYLDTDAQEVFLQHTIYVTALSFSTLGNQS
jgi:hypothetical protein